MSWELTAEQQGRAFLLPALDGVQWETETGSAGRLSFSLAAEGPLLREGARIRGGACCGGWPTTSCAT